MPAPKNCFAKSIESLFIILCILVLEGPAKRRICPSAAAIALTALTTAKPIAKHPHIIFDEDLNTVPSNVTLAASTIMS